MASLKSAKFRFRKSASGIVGGAVGAVRSRRELIIDNAILCHQVSDSDVAASTRHSLS
jgi:hypothetical protein